METLKIQTVKGPVNAEDLGLILPHEHLFTDLRGPFDPGYGEGDPEAVVQVMSPYLAEAQAAGVTALVECSTIGVGRNIPILQRLAEITPIHIIAPTGVYREAFIPERLLDVSTEKLIDEWVRDLTVGIEGSQACAGFIKLAVSDEGITEREVRNLIAAAHASQRTGAAIASHTISGELALREMDILETNGLDLCRFIWVHANIEPDPAYHLKAAQRGAWVEFDAIGADQWQDQDLMLEYTLNLIEAGYAESILLSHDAGWYDPSQPDGQPEDSGIRGYTALFEEYLPALRARGLSDKTINMLTVTNPARAFAMA